MRLYLLRIPEEIEETTFEYLLSFISRKRKEKIHKFRFKKDQYRSLFGELIVQKLINDKTSVYKVVEFNFNAYDKPMCDDLEFNVSHSGDYIFVGVDDKPIGVDIEEVNEIDLSISKHVFNEKEIELLKNNEANNRDTFYRLWTMKESLIKAMGLGFSADVKSLSVMLNDDSSTPCGWYINEYELPCYKLAVCSNKNCFPKDIEVLSVEKLISNFR